MPRLAHRYRTGPTVQQTPEQNLAAREEGRQEAMEGPPPISLPRIGGVDYGFHRHKLTKDGVPQPRLMKI